MLAEATLQKVLDHTPSVVFVKDAAGRYAFVNRQFERAAGLPRESILGRTAEEVFGAEVAARFLQNDRRAFDERRVLELEDEITVHGDKRTFLSSLFPLLDGDGQAYALCGVLRDITTRKRTEDALRRAALAVSSSEGPNVFETLARSVAEILGVDLGFIASFADEHRTQMRILAFHLDGRLRKPFTYRLEGTPCATVVGREFRSVATGAREEFPTDDMFARLGLESYAAYPVNDASGQPLGLIGAMDRRPLRNAELAEAILKIFSMRAAAEIERGRAEEALRASEASYREIFEASEDAIFVHDWDTGAILEVSAKAQALYGYSAEELRSISIAALSAEGLGYTQERGLRVLERAKRQPTPLRVEWRARHKDGHLMWHEVTIKAATIAGHRRILAFVRDITERKAADEALRGSEEQYREIFNAAADGLVLRDAAFRIVDLNPAFTAMTGYERDEALGADRVLVIDQDAADRPLRALHERALQGETLHLEMPGVRKDGTRVELEVRGVPVQYQRRPHVLFIIRDITARKRANEALRRSEELLRTTVEVAFDSVISMDGEGRIIEFNRAAERCFGYSRAEAIGRPLEELIIPPRYRAAHAAGIARWRRTGQASMLGRRVELQAMRADGSEFPVEVAIAVSRRREGEIFVGYLRDITERKAADEALRGSEEQYRAIFNATADALVLRDDAFRVVDVNPAYEAMSGYRREEVIGRDRVVANPPEMDEPIKRLHRKALAGEPIVIETERVRKDGTRANVELRGVPIQHRGRPHVLYMGRDITARKLGERALRASEEQYRAIFNAAADSLVLRDAEFRVVDVNPAYCALSGNAREEVIAAGRTLGNSPELEALLGTLHRKALAGASAVAEMQRVRPDGRRFDLEVRAVPMQYGGKPHVLFIGRDISARKRAEAERLELERQLRQGQKMQAIGQLTGGIAHDFNNLLASIMGYVVLSMERPALQKDPKLGGYLEQALASCRRARDLIQQMLTFSRGQRSTPRPLALAEAVESSMTLLRSSLPSTLELTAALARETPAVMLDPVQLDQVLLNLCINARDAMAGSGRIEVSVSSAPWALSVCSSCRERFSGEFVALAVADNGPGIRPEVLERMFEPFFTTKEVGQGSGMGLATVHGIVHEHGGHIVVDTAPGKGSRFSILLPTLADGTKAAGAEAGPPALAARARLAGRVLVVDDEESVAEFMRELLETWGVVATAISSPSLAQETFAADPRAFDAVITDHTMPGTTGLALAREMLARRPGLPVILYTGHSDGIAARELESAGIRALLHKPVEPEALYGLLKTCLD